MNQGQKVVCNDVAWTCDDKFVISSIYWTESENFSNFKNKIKVWTPDGTLIYELNVS